MKEKSRVTMQEQKSVFQVLEATPCSLAGYHNEQSSYTLILSFIFQW